MAERMRPPTDAELEAALRDLADRIAYPPTPPIARAVADRLRRPRPAPWWARWGAGRRLALALVVLLLLLGAGLVLWPPTRAAIADRLGLPGVTIERVPAIPTAPPATPAPPPATTPALVGTATATVGTGAPVTATPASVGERLNLGRRLTLTEARRTSPFALALPDLPEWGEPDEVYRDEAAPGRPVAFVYRARPDRPAAGATGVALLLVQMEAEVATASLGKGAGPETRIEQVTLDGDTAFWLTGAPHTVFYLDARGQSRPETMRLAGNVLLWQRGPITCRLEGALAREEALRVARSLR